MVAVCEIETSLHGLVVDFCSLYSLSIPPARSIAPKNAIPRMMFLIVLIVFFMFFLSFSVCFCRIVKVEDCSAFALFVAQLSGFPTGFNSAIMS